MIAARTRTKGTACIAAVVAMLVAGALLGAPAASAQAPPGGPILVVQNPGDRFGGYLEEILRAEGLDEFAATSVGAISPQALAGYDVVVLATTGLDAGQVAALSNWVAGGGNLIAIKPDPQLAPLLGLSGPGGSLANAYLRVDTGGGPGAGITGDTMQFHGSADRYALAGASAVATLYAGAGTPTDSPAVSLRSVGASGGQAAAFTYDLARSVVLTRQGNPDWAGQERDGMAPIRSDDLFYPDWVDFDKIAIPQADEQQRLLANLITQMALDRKPLPRFWYLPRGERAAVVLTGDGHGSNVTDSQFAWYRAVSPSGCSVADWQCVRATSYVYANSDLTDAQAAAYRADGFELALHYHVSGPVDCNDFGPAATVAGVAGVQADLAAQLAAFSARWPSAGRPTTSRTHCIVWSDWSSEASAELANGIRLDTTYYYWPQAWVNDRPGLFTGSGLPMRFAASDGSLIDVYQAATQITDESGQDIPKHIAALLDNALGANGYYAVVTANMHNDPGSLVGGIHPGAQAIVAAAQARGVPVVSAAQMLEWLDGRNGSSFGGLSYAGGQLRFSVSRAAGARGLQGMVPASATTGALQALTRNGQSVSTDVRVIKGIAYAMFDATSGDYVAQYPAPAGGAPTTGARRASRAPARPRVSVKLLTRRVSKRGTLTLRVGCPKAERRCRLSLVLKYGRRTAARAKVTVKGGRSVKVKLRLTPAARRLLGRRGRLRVDCVITATSTRGHRSKRTVRLTLRAPAR